MDNSLDPRSRMAWSLFGIYLAIAGFALVGIIGFGHAKIVFVLMAIIGVLMVAAYFNRFWESHD